MKEALAYGIIAPSGRAKNFVLNMAGTIRKRKDPSKCNACWDLFVQSLTVTGYWG